MTDIMQHIKFYDCRIIEGSSTSIILDNGKIEEISNIQQVHIKKRYSLCYTRSQGGREADSAQSAPGPTIPAGHISASF